MAFVQAPPFLVPWSLFMLLTKDMPGVENSTDRKLPGTPRTWDTFFFGWGTCVTHTVDARDKNGVY